MKRCHGRGTRRAATLATLAVHGVLGESAPEAFRVGVLGDG